MAIFKMVFDEFRGFFRRNPEKGVIYLLFSFFFVYFAANFKKMKKILYIVLMVAAMVSCGSDYEEQKRLSKAERLRLAKEDSAALKVGTLPTMDCRSSWPRNIVCSTRRRPTSG